MTTLADNLARVRERAGRAAVRSGRNADAVTLVAVTKGRDASAVQALWDLGQHDFGENRVQEALPKIAAGPETARWHLIGHLQENKINKILPRVFMIQSVDSLDLAAALAARAERSGRKLPVLLEVKTSPEPTKHGFALEAMDEAAPAVAALAALELRGFMTLAPLAAPEADTRQAFRALARVGAKLERWVVGPPILSMGMSDDFEIAIEEGSTLVRVGRALWDERD
jgi:pyridoxal phosphate enzyme (YggS family)